MHHLLGWTVDTVTATLTDITPVTDDIWTISNAHFLPRENANLIWAAAMATNLQRAQVETPTILQMTPAMIRGIMAGLVPTSPQEMLTLAQNPQPLLKTEEIIIRAIQNAGVNQRITCLAGVQITPNPPAIGEQFWMRGTSVTAAVANAWTTLAVTWASNLPQGNYAVTGLAVQSTNAQAARCIFENVSYRPGSISIPGLGNISHPYFKLGGLGQWGVFQNYAMPNIQVLANGADAAHEIYLGIMPL